MCIGIVHKGILDRLLELFYAVQKAGVHSCRRTIATVAKSLKRGKIDHNVAADLRTQSLPLTIRIKARVRTDGLAKLRKLIGSNSLRTSVEN